MQQLVSAERGACACRWGRGGGKKGGAQWRYDWSQRVFSSQQPETASAVASLGVDNWVAARQTVEPAAAAHAGLACLYLLH